MVRLVKKYGSYNRFILAGAMVVIVLTLLLVVFVMGSKGLAEPYPEALITIDGTAISEEEFLMFLQDEKAATAAYFYKKYGAEYSSAFWTTDYGGELPIDVAKSRALSKLIEVKSEQQLAVRHGVLKSASFEEIKQELDKESSIYGVDSLALFQKYMVYHSKLVLEAMGKYKAESEGVQEAELLHYYKANQEERYTASDELKVIQFQYVTPHSEKGNQLVKQLEADIANGLTLESLEAKYTLLELRIGTKNYGSHEGKDENSSELEVMLKNGAYGLKLGEISQPFVYGNQSFILQCAERVEGAMLTFQEVKAAIEDLLKEERFNRIAEETKANAKVTIRSDSYSELLMQ